MGLWGEAPRIDSSGALPPTGEIRWIGPSPAYVERTKRQARIAIVVLPLILVAMIVVPVVALYPKVGYEGLMKVLDTKVEFKESFVTLGLMLVLFLSLPFTLKSASQGYRLGASTAGLHFEIPRARAFGFLPRGSIPWREVLYDGRWLMAGDRQFIGLQGMFDGEELRRTILAHIPRENLLSPGEMTVRLIRRQWYLFVPMLAVVALVVWLSCFG